MTIMIDAGGNSPRTAASKASQRSLQVFRAAKSRRRWRRRSSSSAKARSIARANPPASSAIVSSPSRAIGRNSGRFTATTGLPVASIS